MRTLVILLWLLSFGLLGCAPSTSSAPTESVPDFTLTLDGTPLAASTTAVPINTNAPQVITLVVWWPDTLAPPDDPAVTALLSEQINAFIASEPNVDVEFRLKRAQDVGGIMSTMRSAASVAPAALPDLTLIRREDLISAVQNGLVQPLEGLVPSGVISDLYPASLNLGRVSINLDEETAQTRILYGLAYLLDPQVLVYRLLPEENTVPTGWSFEQMLAREAAFAFPAARTASISDVFYMQYLSAGGASPADDNRLTLSREALTTTLTFYEEALALGLIDDRVLGYTNAGDYIPRLIDNDLNAAVMHWRSYQELVRIDQTEDLLLGLIPTADGQPSTVLNGWMWVVVTSNADRQAVSSHFINWMMDSQRQASYAEAVRLPPSQRSTLRLTSSEALATDAVDQLLNNAVVPPQEIVDGAVLRLMQTALTDVLAGEATADTAVAEVVDALAND